MKDLICTLKKLSELTSMSTNENKDKKNFLSNSSDERKLR